MSTTVIKPGYEGLAAVLQRALDQSSNGKGSQRHARGGEPFERQVICEGARRFGTGSLLFQAYKKAEESQRLPDDRAVAELLGAIVYLAAAVIVIEEQSVDAAPRYPQTPPSPVQGKPFASISPLDPLPPLPPHVGEEYHGPSQSPVKLYDADQFRAETMRAGLDAVDAFRRQNPQILEYWNEPPAGDPALGRRKS